MNKTKKLNKKLRWTKMKSERFYKLDHGWATKYYWFDIVENFSSGKGNFEDRIKKRELTFSKQSGTASADSHGSTMAINFYSKKFIDIIKKNKVFNFTAYKLEFVKEMKDIGDYYYVEPKDSLPAHLKREEKTQYVKHASFYLKDWKGQEFFGIKGTRIIIITEKLKELIVKERLKNVEFEEIKPII